MFAFLNFKYGIALLILIVLSLFMNLCFCDLKTDNSRIKSVNAESAVCEINTLNDFLNFRDRVNSGENFLNETVMLNVDLDLKGIEWIPIANSTTNKFAGIFDGQQHKISNLSLGCGINGLFGVVSGVVQNLIVQSTINITSSTSTTYVGGIVGVLQKDNITAPYGYVGSLKNCVSYTTLNIEQENTKNTLIGGVVGQASYGEFSNCAIYVTNNYDFNLSAKMYFGLMGANLTNCSIENCVAYGNIELQKTRQEQTNIVFNADSLVFAEPWSFCEQCSQMFLNFDNTHQHAPTITTVYPELEIATYEYSTEPITLQFKPIKTINESDDVCYSYEILSQNLGENFAKVSLVGENANKYELAFDTVTFYVEPKLVLIEIENNESVYGESIKQINYTPYNSDFDITFGLSLNGEITQSFDTNVYEIVIASNKPNYKIEIKKEAFYTIIPRTLTLKENNFKFEFNNQDQKPNLVFENILLQDKNAVCYRFNDTMCLNSGTYSLKIALSGEKALNYILQENIVNVTILPKKVCAEWQTTDFYFNNDFQFPLANIELGVEDANFKFDYINYGKNVGKYTVEIVTENKNYLIENSVCEYDIQPLDIEVVWSETTKIFNNTYQTPKFSYDLPIDYDFEILLNSNCLNVGNYEITAYTNDKNINLTNANTNFSIQPYALYLNWVKTEFVFDNQPHNPDFNFSLAFNYNVTITTSTPKILVGTYDCFANTQDNNIVISNAVVKFNIKPFDCEISWGNTRLIFNNTYQSPQFSINLPFDYDLRIIAPLGQKNAGQYTYEINYNDNNILIENLSTNYEILPLNLTLNYTNTVFTFDDLPHLPLVTYELPFNYDLQLITNQAQTNVGEYTLNVSCLDKNFNLLNDTCSYTILQKVVAVIWGNNTFEYNGYTQSPQFDYERFGYDFDIDLSGQGENVGEYVAILNTTDKNIKLTNATCNYGITPLICEVIWSNTDFVYNGEIQCPTATLNLAENINKNVIDLTVLGGARDIGTYTVTAQTSNKNIVLKNTTCDFIINKNEFVYENSTNDLRVEVSGAIDGEIEIKVVSNEIDKVLPQGYNSVYAFILEIENVSVQKITNLNYTNFSANKVLNASSTIENNTYLINISLSNIKDYNNLKLFQISNDINEVQYTLKDNTISFYTDNLGLICVAEYSNELYQIKILLIACISGVVLLAIGFVAFAVHLKRKQIVYFRKNN